MGQRYYEVTLPKLVKQIERLNANLERIAVIVDAEQDKDSASDSSK